MKKYTPEVVVFCVLAVIGISTRTILEFGPNVEFVTAISLAGGLFLKTKLRYFLPIVVMIISDLYLGNTLILLFTWSAYFISPFFSKLINTDSLKEKYISGVGAGVLFVLFFFAWTNFGVVVTSSLYPITISGFVSAYINAIPFLLNQLFSVVVTIPVVFSLVLILSTSFNNNPKLSLHE